jgi:hypothetical protein
MSGNNKEQENNLVLAVDVPESAAAGSTFHVALENRFFEVTVPEGVTPGQTINIIVPQTASVEDGTVFSSVEAVRDAAVQQAKILDETYKITDKVKALGETYKVTERAQALTALAQEYDAKYAISSKVNAYLTTGINKSKELDQTYQISTKAVVLGERIIAYAKEIDAKLALSATSARVVVAGANAIVLAWRKALAINEQHKITEIATQVVTKTLDTVHTVTTTVKQRLPALAAAPAAAPAVPAM